MNHKRFLNDLSKAFAYFELTKNRVPCTLLEGKDYDMLTDNLKKIKIVYSFKLIHKTFKNGRRYEYNMWELQIPEKINFDYLFFVIYEGENKEVPDIIGYFIFSSDLITEMKKSKSLSIFESDITGSYRKEPKINKFKYFKNVDILKK